MLNNCQRRLLPTLAVLFAPAVMAQGIIYVQMPPSPSLGLVQDPNTGQWVDPFASYDAQGLRLWGTAQSPATYNLVLNGQVAYTFTSQDSGFTNNEQGTIKLLVAILTILVRKGHTRCQVALSLGQISDHQLILGLEVNLQLRLLLQVKPLAPQFYLPGLLLVLHPLTLGWNFILMVMLITVGFGLARQLASTADGFMTMPMKQPQTHRLLRARCQNQTR